MVINPNHPAVTNSNFWQSQLNNNKILLNEIDKAIFAFTTEYQSANAITEYTIDTGQDKQTVRRSDLGSLNTQRTELMKQIAILEARLGIGGSRVITVHPGF